MFNANQHPQRREVRKVRIEMRPYKRIADHPVLEPKPIVGKKREDHPLQNIKQRPNLRRVEVVEIIPMAAPQIRN